MKFDINLKRERGSDYSGDCIVYFVAQNDDETPIITHIPDLPEAPFSDFQADEGETQFFYSGEFEADRLLLVGLGEKEELELSQALEAAASSVSPLEKLDIEQAAVVLPVELFENSEKLAEKTYLGFALAGYEFEQFKSEDNDEDDDEDVELGEIMLLFEDGRRQTSIERGIDSGKNIARAVSLSRDLGNTPANQMTPIELEAQAADIAGSSNNITLNVIDGDQLKENNFNLIRAVGQGSEHPPRLLELVYEPSKYQQTVVLVGKGVTFDTGGISLKPSKKMGEMKFDMSGAGVVLGLMQAVDQLKLPLRVVGLTPCVENMPDSRSTRPGDIVEGYAGKTVEILNTDAEGRLILADTLSYASEKWGEKADYLLDYATLTGASIVVLGHAGACLMGNDDKLCESLIKAGKTVDERLWRLPLWEDYEKKIESETADVKNIGGRAGTIIGGTFLRQFIDEEKFDSWAHLDIAATAWGMKEKSFRPEGGTGFGVQLTLEFLRDL